MPKSLLRPNRLIADSRAVSIICLAALIAVIAIVAFEWSWIKANQANALFLATLLLASVTGLLFWATYKAAVNALTVYEVNNERIDRGVTDQLINLLKTVEQRMLIAQQAAGHPLSGDDWLLGQLLNRVFSPDAAVALCAIDPAVSAKVYEAVRRTQTSIASIEHTWRKYHEAMNNFRALLNKVEAGDTSGLPATVE